MKERRRNARVGLLGRVHRKFRTFGDVVGPALHDALVARVKAKRCSPVRARSRVQSHSPGVWPFSSRFLTGEDARPTLWRGRPRPRNECNRTREIRHADNRQDRPENLFSRDAIIGFTSSKSEPPRKKPSSWPGTVWPRPSTTSLAPRRDARI